LMAPDLVGQKLEVAIGEVALFIASLSWATGSWLGRHHKFQTSLFLLSSVQMFVGGTAMAGISLVQNLFRSEVLGAVAMESWVAVAYLIVFGSCIGFTAYIYLLTNVAASRVATYAYVNPILAVLLGALILHEPLTVWIWTGMAIILFSLSLIRH